MQLDPGIKMICQPYTRSYVQNVSLTALEDVGWDVADDRDMCATIMSEQQRDWYLSKLTRRQQRVAEKLYEGYNRKETAKDLRVSLQAVHQIILRMRHRILVKTGLKI
jgi:DNA-binding NarL/FixJ family response regulator